MNGVVAMLHEGSTPIPELHRKRDTSTGTKTIHVLSPSLPRRNLGRISIARQDLTFLEVDVNRVIPPAASVLQGPDLAGAVFRCGRDSSKIGVERCALI